MKRIVITLLATVLFANIAMASAELVKQKAKQQRDINNQQQGVTTPAPGTPAATSTPGTPSTPQGINPAQQALLDHLQTDFAAVKAGAPATADEKQHLVTDLSVLAKGVKPTKDQLTKLANDLANALAEKTPATKDLAQMAKDVNIVCNCGFLSAAQSQTFIAETQSILKKSGVSEALVTSIGADLKAIVKEVQKNKPQLYQ